MYKKRLLIPVAFVSFVLLLALWSFLDLGSPGTASAETVSGPGLEVLESLSSAFVEVSRIARPSVVNISTTSAVNRSRPGSRSRRDPSQEEGPFRDFFGDEFFRRFFPEEPQSRPRRHLGSGVIVHEDGYILTNNHVVGDADKIKVTLSDEREFDAKLVGADKDTDVAVIQIDADDLPVAKLGDSDDLQVGQLVLAIGNPFGLNFTVTNGIISATGRSHMNLATYEDFIQTNAAINPGNSGGPLVNIRGEVIGVNTAIATGGGERGNVGVGFSIPINMARNVMNDLIDKGEVERGWLGIHLQEVDKDIAEKYGLEEPSGVLVALAAGPAKKAGLRHGDLITEYDGKAVEDARHLQNLVAASKPGKKVKVRVIRGGEEKEFDVELGRRSEEAIAALTPGEAEIPSGEEEEWMGITVQELTDSLAQRLGYEDLHGVLISDVDPDGPAAEVDNPPKRFDLIQEIEFKEVKNMDDYRRAIREVEGKEKVMVRLRRADGGSPYIVLKRE